MSYTNPYTPGPALPVRDLAIRKVHVRPLELLKRGHQLVGDQYWLLLGVTLVAMLVGSAVPFGVLLGPMLVGIYLCYAERADGRRTEFGTLFKGFDVFADSFVAVLILMAVSFVAMLPFLIALFALVFVPILNAQAAGANGPPPGFPVAVLIIYPLMIAVNVLVTMPFLFTFQLIADRRMKAVPAIKASISGVLKNLFGLFGFMFVMGIIMLILMMMCYIPAIFFLPISFAATFVLYRDIYPRTTPTAALS